MFCVAFRFGLCYSFKEVIFLYFVQDNYISYEELKADVLKIGLKTRYDVVLYMVGINFPIKAVAIRYISWLQRDGIITD